MQTIPDRTVNVRLVLIRKEEFYGCLSCSLFAEPRHLSGKYRPVVDNLDRCSCKTQNRLQYEIDRWPPDTHSWSLDPRVFVKAVDDSFHPSLARVLTRTKNSRLYVFSSLS